MDDVARLLAASLAVMFLVAGVVKLAGGDGPKAWSVVVETALGNRLGRVVGKLLPIVELGVAAALVLAPVTGLRLAGAMLALLAGGVLAAARSPLRGTRCSCLGALSRARIGLPLALGNLGLALTAFAASFSVASSSPLTLRTLLAGLGVFLLVALALTVAIGRGPPDERKRLARVVGDAPALNLDALAGVAASLKGGGPRHSRRAALKAAAAASLTVPAVRSAVALARTLSRSGPIAVVAGVTFNDDPDNDFRGTCNDFADRLTVLGVSLPGSARHPNSAGYTWIDGIQQKKAFPANVAHRHDTKTQTSQGFCPCTNTYYNDYTQCTIECPSGLACFGYSCEEVAGQVCITSKYGISFPEPTITIYALKWTPPANSTTSCKQTASEFNDDIESHESQHAQNAIDTVDKFNKDYAHRTAHACAHTYPEALAKVNRLIAMDLTDAQKQATEALDKLDGAFHAGGHGVLDCRKCD